MKYDINGKYRYSYIRRKNSKIKKFFLYIFLSLFIVLLITIITNKNIYKKLFYPQEITISGLTYISENDFIDKFSLNNLSIFNFYKKKLKEKINSLYFVKDYNLKYSFFNKIKIIIIEKPIYFILYDPDRGLFYRISKDYTVLGYASNINIINYVILSKKINKIYKPGDKTEFKVDFFNKTTYFSKEARIISEIKVNIDKIEAFFVDTPFRVEMGNFIDNKKIKNFLLLRNLIKNPEKIDFVDFSFPDIGRIVEKEKGSFNG